MPGGGQTLRRWSALAALGERDLAVARIVEAHADALAILAELGAGDIPLDSCWGVWAAESADHPLIAATDGDGWYVDGLKAWCSAAPVVSHALVTARHGTDRRLAIVALGDPGVTVGPDTWANTGMKRADTRTVSFDRVSARLVGRPGEYVSRSGFWLGGIGVAACWYGGAAAVATVLRERVAKSPEPHAAAHLGAVDIILGAARDGLRAAAVQVDAQPGADHVRLARRVRGTVSYGAAAVIERVGRALGPEPLTTDSAHAQRVADLQVYIRQDHAERDLAALGADVAAAAPDWTL